MGDYCNIIMDSPKSTQKTVTIDQVLWYALDEWLKSSKAKKMGYHSKAQFCTEAVRELFEQHSKNKLTEQRILEELGMLHREINSLSSQTSAIEQDLKRQAFMLYSVGKESGGKKKLDKYAIAWKKKNKLKDLEITG